MSTCPAEYCSMTSLTSYGLRQGSTDRLGIDRSGTNRFWSVDPWSESFFELSSCNKKFHHSDKSNCNSMSICQLKWTFINFIILILIIKRIIISIWIHQLKSVGFKVYSEKKFESGQSDLVFFICIKALHTKCEYVDVCVGGGISKREAKSYRQFFSISRPTQTPPHSNLVQIVDGNEKYSVELSNLHLWHAVKIIMQKNYEGGNITWLTCFSILLVFYSG